MASIQRAYDGILALLQVAQDSALVGGTQALGDALHLLDFVSPAPGGPVIRQLRVGAADVRAGADRELHEDDGFVRMSCPGQDIRPFLQSADQQGIVLIIFGQSRDIGGAVLQL